MTNTGPDASSKEELELRKLELEIERQEKTLALDLSKGALEIRKLEQETRRRARIIRAVGAFGVIATVLFGLFNVFRSTTEAREAREQRRQEAVSGAFTNLISLDDVLFAKGVLGVMAIKPEDRSDTFSQRLLDSITFNPGNKNKRTATGSPPTEFPVTGRRVHLLDPVIQSLPVEEQRRAYEAVLDNPAFGTERLNVLPSLAGLMGQEIWLDTFEKGDRVTRSVIATMLAVQGTPESVEHLRQLLWSEDSSYLALRALALAPLESAQALVLEAIQSPNGDVIWAVIDRLYSFSFPAEQYVELLDQVLEARSHELRTRALQALSALEGDDRSLAIPLFIRGLEDRVGYVTESAVGGLENFRDVAAVALGPLRKAAAPGSDTWRWPRSDTPPRDRSEQLKREIRDVIKAIETETASRETVGAAPGPAGDTDAY